MLLKFKHEERPQLADGIYICRGLDETESKPEYSCDVSVLIMTLDEEANIGTVIQDVRTPDFLVFS